MHIIKKLSTIILVVSLIFSLNAPAVLAGFSYPSPTSAMNQILGDLGVDKGELKNNIQIMNVSRQKKTPPQVSLTFTPASPVQGSKITASASPTYFMNDTTKLYYTWYLKHSGTGGDDGQGNDDLNKDGRVNIEDYKIAAMRIIANNDFEWQKADYSANRDSDGYTAIFGGEDQKGKNVHCFIHNFESGNEYELTSDKCKHLFPHAPNEKTGDGNFGENEEKFWHTNPNSDDTANDGTLDEAAVAGLGKTEFSWLYMPGDKVGVVVEGISVESTSYKDSSYKTMWAMPKNSCDADTSDQLPEDNSTQTSETTYDPDSNDKIVTTTTIANHYSRGAYTIRTGNAPGTAVVVVKTITFRTQKYRLNMFSGNNDYNEVPYSDVTVTPSYLDANNRPFTGDETNLFYNYNIKYPNPSEPTITGQVLSVSNSFDLNDCLLSNLVEPTEGTSDKKMDVTLSYLPDAPTNDPSGDNSDELVVQSSILNVTNKDFVNYEWSVSLGNSISTDNWIALGADTRKQVGLNQMTGIGLRSLKMKMNINRSDVFFVKVTLRAKENGSGNLKKEGVGTIIIPVYGSSNKIEVFSTTASSNSNVSLDTSADSKRCTTGIAKVLCPVVKNEIVGLKTDINPDAYTITWALNGETLPPESNSSLAFFPILQDKGAKYTVSLNASNKNSEKKITLTKTFIVTDPEVSIVAINSAGSTCLPVLLGHYVDPLNKTATGEDSLWPDYSEDSFEALQGTTIKLKATPNIPFFNTFSWVFDGNLVTTANAAELGVTLNADGTLSIPVNKMLDASYSVGTEALYTQSSAIKKVLNTKWGVSLADFYEKPVGKAITIRVTDQLSDGTQVLAKTADKKILASLFSAMPAYIGFLFRVMLTIMLILVSTGLLFSLFPKQDQN